MHNRNLYRWLGKTLSVFFLALTGAIPLSAQGGSSYSIFNIGDLYTTNTAAGAGLAGIESAVPYSKILNSLNPASWTGLRYVSIQAGMTFEQYRISDAEQSIWQNRTSLRNFSAGFPFSEKYGGTFGLGVRPYSTVNYRTGLRQQVPTGSGDSVETNLTYSGTGGVTEGFAGVSFKPVDWLSVGVSPSLYFGTIENRTLVDFPTSSLNDAGYLNIDRFSGFGATTGVLIRATDDLRVGATFSTPATLDVERTQLGIFREGGFEDTASLQESTHQLEIPARMTLGATYRVGRTVLAGEGLIQSWDGHARLEGTARNRLRTALAAEYLPSTSAASSGIDRWTFRTGLWFEQTYYALEQGDINAMAVTFGFNVPFSSTGRLGSGSGMDVAVELGTRGTTDNGLTQELFGKFSLELAINELWFQDSRR